MDWQFALGYMDMDTAGKRDHWHREAERVELGKTVECAGGVIEEAGMGELVEFVETAECEQTEEYSG